MVCKCSATLQSTDTYHQLSDAIITALYCNCKKKLFSVRLLEVHMRLLYGTKTLCTQGEAQVQQKSMKHDGEE